MQFGTMIDEDDAYSEKKKKGGGGGTRETEKSAQNDQKTILKNFYSAVLNK